MLAEVGNWWRALLAPFSKAAVRGRVRILKRRVKSKGRCRRSAAHPIRSRAGMGTPREADGVTLAAPTF
jgi:hypothetical protein